MAIPTAPIKDRRYYWAYMNAQISFEHARACAETLLRLGLPTDDVVAQALQISMAVAYSRPFKQSGRQTRVPLEWVPPELLDQHYATIKIRDQVNAHTDIDGFQDQSGTLLNKVVIFSEHGNLMVGSTPMVHREPGLQAMAKLADLLHRRASHEADAIWKRYWNSAPMPAGRYEINLSNDNDAFVVPLAW